MDAVEQVVGCHQRTRPALADGNFKAAQVDLAHGAFADLTVAAVAIRLLIVCREVLERRAAAGVLLHAQRDRGGKFAGDQGIFGEILEVASAADVAVDVQRRSEPQVHAEALHLVADQIAAQLGKAEVPALRERRSDRDGGAVLLEDLALCSAVSGKELQPQRSRRRHQLQDALRKPAAHGVDAGLIADVLAAQAQTGRAVRHDHRRDALLPQGDALPRRAGNGLCRVSDHACRALALERADAHEAELLVAQPLDQRIDRMGEIIVHGLGPDARGVHRSDGEIRQRVFRARARPPVGKVRSAEAVFDLSDRRLAVQADDGDGARIAARRADTQHIVALLQNPRGARRVIGGQLAQIRRERQALFLARFQVVRFFKRRQRLIRLVQSALRLGDIQLHDLFAAAASGVVHGNADADDAVFLCDRAFCQVKCRIAQTEAERKQRLSVRAVEVAVADIDALAIARFVLVAEAADRRIVPPGAPRRGQLSRGRAFAEEDVREDAARLDAELAEQQDVADLHDRTEIDDAADVQHQQEVFVRSVERQDVALFRLGEQDVAGDGAAVGALAGDARQDVDGGIPGSVQRQVVFGLRHHGAHVLEHRERTALQGRTLQLADKALLCLGVQRPVAVQPRLARDAEACRLQSRFGCDKIAGVDLAGARSALDRAARAAAVKRQIARRVQRERPAASEQNRAFRAETPQDRSVIFFILHHVDRSFIVTIPLL